MQCRAWYCNYSGIQQHGLQFGDISVRCLLLCQRRFFVCKPKYPPSFRICSHRIGCTHRFSGVFRRTKGDSNDFNHLHSNSRQINDPCPRLGGRCVGVYLCVSHAVYTSAIDLDQRRPSIGTAFRLRNPVCYCGYCDLHSLASRIEGYVRAHRPHVGSGDGDRQTI